MTFIFSKVKKKQFLQCIQWFTSIERHKLFKFSNKISLSLLEVKNSLKLHSISELYMCIIFAFLALLIY